MPQSIVERSICMIIINGEDIIKKLQQSIEKTADEIKKTKTIRRDVTVDMKCSNICVRGKVELDAKSNIMYFTSEDDIINAAFAENATMVGVCKTNEGYECPVLLLNDNYLAFTPADKKMIDSTPNMLNDFTLMRVYWYSTYNLPNAFWSGNPELDKYGKLAYVLETEDKYAEQFKELEKQIAAAKKELGIS